MTAKPTGSTKTADAPIIVDDRLRLFLEALARLEIKYPQEGSGGTKTP